MTLPANIRVNVGAPFPTVVKGTGPVTIGRANGVWTIGLSPMLFIEQKPPVATALPMDYVLVWDSIAGVWVRVSLASIMVPIQRAVTAAPVAITGTDQILHLNLTAPTTIALPTFASRNGLPLVFKDVGMQATANPITLAPSSGETIDGFGSALLGVNGQSIRLVPANDGINLGWFRE
jgi:hypothetical protein